MPELPEVETIRRGLLDLIVGKKICKVEIFCDKSFVGEKSLVEGAEIAELRRFGKAMIIDLSNGVSIMVHLRMTGQLIFRGKKEFAGGHPSDSFFEDLPNKQTRVEIDFDDGVLYFNDQRKFGYLKVLPTAEVEQDSFIAKLGKEPWAMDVSELYKKFQRKKNSCIKAVLLDQTVMAGLGNIYADEALHFAKVHPETLAGSLNMEEVTQILEGARLVMSESIESGGSTMATYVKADGTRGDYLQKFAKVFRREGEPCYNCGTEIIKMRVAGRGTHICPKCQRRNNV